MLTRRRLCLCVTAFLGAFSVIWITLDKTRLQGQVPAPQRTQLSPVATVDVTQSFPEDVRTLLLGSVVHSFVARPTGLYFLVTAPLPNGIGQGRTLVVQTGLRGELLRAIPVSDETVQSVGIVVGDRGQIALFQGVGSSSGRSGGSVVVYDSTGSIASEYECPRTPRAIYLSKESGGAVEILFDEGAFRLDESGLEGPIFAMSNPHRPSYPLFVGNGLDSFAVIEGLTGTIQRATKGHALSSGFQPPISEFEQAWKEASAKLAKSEECGAFDVLVPAASIDESGNMFIWMSNVDVSMVRSGALIGEYDSGSRFRRAVLCMLPRFKEYLPRFHGGVWAGSPEGTMFPAHIGAADNQLFIADNRGKVAIYRIGGMQ